MTRLIIDRTNMWKIIVIMATFISIAGILGVGIQKKTPVIAPVPGHKIFMREMGLIHPSPESVTELKAFVTDHPTVAGVNLAAASFQSNNRSSAFYYSRFDELNMAWATDPSGQALFTKDQFQNDRVVKLINGKFVCYRTRDTAVGMLHPTLLKYSTVTCSVSIPPGYGDFIGWINIHITGNPSGAQLSQMRALAEKLATSIYTRDVLKRKEGDHEGSTN